MTCNKEAPSVEEVAQRYAGKVTVLGVAWNGSEASMVDFQQRHALTFPTLRDADGALFARFDVPYQPAFVFIDAAGSVDRVIGSLDAEAFDQRLATLAAG